MGSPPQKNAIASLRRLNPRPRTKTECSAILCPPFAQVKGVSYAGSRLVGYYRVSSDEQGRSGLGLEAQREAVLRFAEANGFAVVGEQIEVETGKGADALDRRPRLAAALGQARKLKCPVCVAKLDRLSRDVAFIAGLRAQRVPFVVAEPGPVLCSQ